MSTVPLPVQVFAESARRELEGVGIEASSIAKEVVRRTRGVEVGAKLTRFLNRLLALRVEMQGKVFGFFSALLVRLQQGL